MRADDPELWKKTSAASARLDKKNFFQTMSIRANVRWIAVSQAVRIATQLISVTVLTRLLSPPDYGLMAIAGVFINLAGLFRDFGTGAAIVQREELDENICNSVFWLNLLLGLLIFLVLTASAPLVANFYHFPSLTFILVALAINFPLTCITIVPGALFERASNFKLLALLEASAVLIGLIVALVSAFAGMGVYSLVAQALTSTVVQASGIWLLSQWRPTQRPHLVSLKQILDFSVNVSSFQFINYFSRNADSFIIGKMLGASTLGLYSVAYKLMLFPVQNMSYVAARALFPVMSREHAAGRSVAPGLVKSLSAIAYISAPLMAGLFTFRESFTSIVFGNRWSGLPELLAWLAPIGFIQSILSTTGSAFMASGNARTLLKCGIVGAVLSVGSFVIGAQFGIVDFVTFYFIANVLNAGYAIKQLNHAIGVKYSDILRNIVFPVCSVLILAVLARAADEHLKNTTSLPEMVRMGIGICGFCFLYLASSFLLARHQLTQVLTLLVGNRFRSSRI